MRISKKEKLLELASSPIFVVQEHNSSRLHWDLRLQVNKVLFSWAVPKGIPEEIGINRLAIRVDDHALSWANFSGIIPKGEYGAGTVKILDKGHYLPLKLSKEKMEFELIGKKFKGVWKLSRMRNEENKWILERIE